MSLASCVLCAQLYLCAPARHLPYVCPCPPRTCLSASAWVCLSCFLCVAKRACLGHMSAWESHVPVAVDTELARPVWQACDVRLRPQVELCVCDEELCVPVMWPSRVVCLCVVFLS